MAKEKKSKPFFHHPSHGKYGYQLKAGQVTSWQITRILRQAQGTSPSVDSGHRFLSLSKDAGE